MVTVKEILVKDIAAKTRIPAADYVINPYIGCPHKCLYCYAEFMKRFSNHAEAWGDFLDVKRCSTDINIKKLSGKSVLFGSVTDAYNPFEKKYNNTRGILRRFIGAQANVEILTKSALVVRDIDIFKQIPRIRIGISMNTLDDSIRQALEPNASSIAERVEALKTLHNAGVDNYVFLSPLFPGISSFVEILNECKDYVNAFYFENLNLRGASRGRVMKYIRDYHTYLLPVYDEIYKNKNNAYWHELEREIKDYCEEHRLRYGSYFYHEKIKKK